MRFYKLEFNISSDISVERAKSRMENIRVVFVIGTLLKEEEKCDSIEKRIKVQIGKFKIEISQVRLDLESAADCREKNKMEKIPSWVRFGVCCGDCREKNKMEKFPSWVRFEVCCRLPGEK